MVWYASDRKGDFFKRFYFFLHLFDSQITSRQRAGREREREVEAGSPLSREPDMGLNPRSLGS